ncbi:hypothetical protein ACFQ7F_00520 [Streptomyces sp. NPDC056486]|uniref:hypothetical protein n=1 Tax=Streptomyces sp. NPDC056486 TaxID=3345835 RepID=UPI00367EDC61
MLYRHRRLDLVRLAVLLVDDIPTAEDVVQEAFAALSRRHGNALDHIADPGARARMVIHPALRKAAVVLLTAALAAVLLVLPRLLSRDDPSAPADTPPPARPSSSTSPSPASSPSDETPGPVAP